MNTSSRNILSTVTALALVAYTVFALVEAGFASTTAVIGISALTVWALGQMIVLELTHGSAAQSSTIRPTPPPVRSAAVIAFPRAESLAPRAA